MSIEGKDIYDENLRIKFLKGSISDDFEKKLQDVYDELIKAGHKIIDIKLSAYGDTCNAIIVYSEYIESIYEDNGLTAFVF